MGCRPNPSQVLYILYPSVLCGIHPGLPNHECYLLRTAVHPRRNTGSCEHSPMDASSMLAASFSLFQCLVVLRQGCFFVLLSPLLNSLLKRRCWPLLRQFYLLATGTDMVTLDTQWTGKYIYIYTQRLRRESKRLFFILLESGVWYVLPEYEYVLLEGPYVITRPSWKHTLKAFRTSLSGTFSQSAWKIP